MSPYPSIAVVMLGATNSLLGQGERGLSSNRTGLGTFGVAFFGDSTISFLIDCEPFVISVLSALPQAAALRDHPLARQRRVDLVPTTPRAEAISAGGVVSHDWRDSYLVGNLVFGARLLLSGCKSREWTRCNYVASWALWSALEQAAMNRLTWGELSTS